MNELSGRPPERPPELPIMGSTSYLILQCRGRYLQFRGKHGHISRHCRQNAGL